MWVLRIWVQNPVLARHRLYWLSHLLNAKASGVSTALVNICEYFWLFLKYKFPKLKGWEKGAYCHTTDRENSRIYFSKPCWFESTCSTFSNLIFKCFNYVIILFVVSDYLDVLWLICIHCFLIEKYSYKFKMFNQMLCNFFLLPGLSFLFHWWQCNLFLNSG